MKYKILFFLVAAISLSIVQSKEPDLSLNSLGSNVNYNTPDDKFGNESFLLDSIDAGVTEIYLPDTVGYGDRVRPVAKIKNFGSATADIPARMKIGTSYNQVQNITLGPNCEDTLPFPLLAAYTEGWVMASCSTELFGDENPENDRLVDSIYVRRFDYDIGIETIPVPDTIEPGQSIVPRATIKNYGSTQILRWLDMAIEICDSDSNTVLYSDTAIYFFFLMPDETDTIVGFGISVGPCILSFEILAYDSNPSNNKKFKKIYRRPSAIEELPNPFVPIHFSQSTVMQISQFKSYILKSKPEPIVFGIDGRKIKVEKVKEGIYFVKTRTSERKVVVTK